jgi:hypothetical protein
MSISSSINIRSTGTFALPPVYLATVLSFTSVLGQVLAELMLVGRTELPIGFLSLARFSGAGKPRPAHGILGELTLEAPGYGT